MKKFLVCSWEHLQLQHCALIWDTAHVSCCLKVIGCTGAHQQIKQKNNFPFVCFKRLMISLPHRMHKNKALLETKWMVYNWNLNKNLNNEKLSNWQAGRHLVLPVALLITNLGPFSFKNMSGCQMGVIIACVVVIVDGTCLHKAGSSWRASFIMKKMIQSTFHTPLNRHRVLCIYMAVNKVQLGLLVDGGFVVAWLFYVR